MHSEKLDEVICFRIVLVYGLKNAVLILDSLGEFGARRHEDGREKLYVSPLFTVGFGVDLVPVPVVIFRFVLKPRVEVVNLSLIDGTYECFRVGTETRLLLQQGFRQLFILAVQFVDQP